jgi:hypothetical protein
LEEPQEITNQEVGSTPILIPNFVNSYFSASYLVQIHKCKTLYHSSLPLPLIQLIQSPRI